MSSSATTVNSSVTPKAPDDLPRLEAVAATLKGIRDKYVAPDRVKPKEMMLSALNYVQRDVAEVIVLNEDPSEVTIRVEGNETKLRIDDVRGPWDVLAKLREAFAFLQKHVRDKQIDFRKVEYAACNGMLHMLDPHSIFMSPEAYRETTGDHLRGAGALGTVMSIRDQTLTVMSVLPGTPAERAGLKRFDRILKINNESTLNMPLDDAMQRFRGEPGTRVTLWVARDGDAGWQGEKPFEILREIIRVRSVEMETLGGGVGYVRLKAFYATSFKELEAALDALKQKEPLRGLVLDLRGNSGGLLEQAARIADKFIDDGVIVSTTGPTEEREVKRAHGPGTELPYPMVVLMSGASAAASEIVAGALKYLDRAVIVGSQSFGSGSIQLIFPGVTSEKAALKLTIAQFLAPGDVSIQGVGITPDIELDPMTVDEIEMDLMAQEHGLRERDLSAHLPSARGTPLIAGDPAGRRASRSAHLPNAGRPPLDKPSEVLRYQLTSVDREHIRDRDTDSNSFELDFPIRFARDLVLRMPTKAKRIEQIRATHDYIEQTRREELTKVSAELAKLGIDWSDAPEDATAPFKNDVEVKLDTDRPGAEVTAGEPMELRVTVKNNGTQPIYRLWGTTESDTPYFDGKEIIFGKIAPGQSKTATAPLGFCEVEGRKLGSTKPIPANAKRLCKIPMDAIERSDGLRVRFGAAANVALSPVEIRPTVHALKRPFFQYSYQVADDREGNGDGRVQKGEQVSMYLTVKNAGSGRSFETQANIANLSGDGLLLRAGRFDISNMMPGDVRKVAFSFDVQPQLAGSEASLTLTIGDRDLREFASERIKIPILPAVAVATGVPGQVRAGSAGTLLFASAEKGERAFGRLAPGTACNVIGEVGGVEKVDLGSGRFAFVLREEVRPGGSPKKDVPFEALYVHAPPMLEVNVSAGATKDDKVKVTGVASSSEQLLDLYVFVGARKLYYKSNRGGANAKEASFEIDVPLRPGVNVITVVARETPEVTTRRSLVVRKDGPDGSILKTPNTDEPVSAWLEHPSAE